MSLYTFFGAFCDRLFHYKSEESQPENRAMPNIKRQLNSIDTETFSDFVARADYSLMDALNADPESTQDGHDHRPRQVRSGHYVR